MQGFRESGQGVVGQFKPTAFMQAVEKDARPSQEYDYAIGSDAAKPYTKDGFNQVVVRNDEKSPSVSPTRDEESKFNPIVPKPGKIKKKQLIQGY